MDCDCESITFEQNYYREVIDTVARYMIINILEENDEDFEQIPEPFSVENVIAIVVLEQLKNIEKPFKTIKKFYDEPELIEEFIDYEKVSRMMADLFEEKTEILEKIGTNGTNGTNGENKKEEEIQSISRAQAVEELLSKLRKLI